MTRRLSPKGSSSYPSSAACSESCCFIDHEEGKDPLIGWAVNADIVEMDGLRLDDDEAYCNYL